MANSRRPANKSTTSKSMATLLGLLYACAMPAHTLGAGRRLLQNGFQSNCQDDWKQTLALHNAYRALYQAPALKWHVGLAANAQYWAEQLAAKKCKLEHSGPGENLYANYGFKKTGNCVDATKLWFAEEKDYSFSIAPMSNNFMKTGHFTQLVWKNTQFVGCGSATNGNCVVVDCQYLQWGNEQSNDAYSQNVLPNNSGGTVDMNSLLDTTANNPPPPKKSSKPK